MRKPLQRQSAGAIRWTRTRLAPAVLAALALAGPAGAQSDYDGHSASSASPEQVWAEFETSCGALLSDPKGFIDAHPARSDAGHVLINVSDDGQVVVLDHMTEQGVTRQMELIGTPGALHVICELNGSNWDEIPSSMDAWRSVTDQTARDLRAAIEARGADIQGGFLSRPTLEYDHAPSGAAMPDSIYAHVLGVTAEIGGARRFVYVNVGGPIVSLVGHYIIRAEDVEDRASSSGGAAKSEGQAAADAGAQVEPTQGPAAVMRSLAEICLRNYRTPDLAPDAIRAAGMNLSEGMDPQSWEFSGGGVMGLVSIENGIYCSIQSQAVPLDQAREIGAETADRLFQGMVQPGSPEGGTGPCDGLSIFAPRQLIWISYAQAGNSGECITDGSSAIIIR